MAIDLKKIPIFCVNLDKRRQRYEKFCKQPGTKGLTIHRFSAVEGNAIEYLKSDKISLQTKYNIQNKARRSHGEINTLGAIGCSMSHYEVWQKFLQTDASHCLVLEDDARLVEGFAEMVAKYSADFTGDVWALSYKLYDKRLVPVSPGSPWKTPIYYWGTAAYIISREGATKLSSNFFPIECHMDKFFCLQSSLGYIRLVIHDSVMIYTMSYGTDVQMYSCDLCDIPDTLGDYYIVEKRDVFVTFAAAAVSIILAFIIATRKNG